MVSAGRSPALYVGLDVHTDSIRREPGALRLDRGAPLRPDRRFPR
jgi:hypothetical protein